VEKNNGEETDLSKHSKTTIGWCGKLLERRKEEIRRKAGKSAGKK